MINLAKKFIVSLNKVDTSLPRSIIFTTIIYYNYYYEIYFIHWIIYLVYIISEYNYLNATR